MKTPNEIAAEVYERFSGETMDEDMISGLIAEGIEADRAQRAQVLEASNPEDLPTRVYDALMGAGRRALADEVAEAALSRAADLETLADAAANWAEELTEYIIPSASNDSEEAEWKEERDEIQAALGRYLGAKEGE